jgi:phosphatidylserine decarboxylase
MSAHVPDVSPELPSATWRATLALLERLPQAALSRSLGRVADVPIPRPLRRSILGSAARALGIDLSEAELPLEEYGSLNALFVRRLRPDARPVREDPATIVSPVDGIIGQVGHVRNGRLIQAKGRDYSAAALLGDETEARRFDAGLFITLYLSPRHYHRIHAPCSGVISAARHVPGALLPVNEPAVLHVPDLFPRNERVICSIDGPLGRTAVVAVGAYNVGRISTAFDPEWAGPGASVANRRGARIATRTYEPPRAIRQGAEIMAFHLGSTVVLLCEPGLELHISAPGSEVRLGDVLARGEPALSAGERKP